MFLEIFVRPLEIACCFWMWSVPCKNNGTLPEVNLIFITLKRLAGKLNYGQIHSDNFHLFCSLFYHWGLKETTVLYLRSSIGPPILGNHNPLAFCGPCLRHNIGKIFYFLWPAGIPKKLWRISSKDVCHSRYFSLWFWL